VRVLLTVLSALLTITDHCNRLHPDVLEAIECIKSWSKLGLVESIVLTDTLRLLAEHEATLEDVDE